MMDWAVFTTLCRAFPSAAVELLHQTAMRDGQDALHGGPVEVAEELRWQVDSSQPPEEMKALLGLFLMR